jgi:hypothetical protein
VAIRHWRSSPPGRIDDQRSLDSSVLMRHLGLLLLRRQKTGGAQCRQIYFDGSTGQSLL